MNSSIEDSKKNPPIDDQLLKEVLLFIQKYHADEEEVRQYFEMIRSVDKHALGNIIQILKRNKHFLESKSKMKVDLESASVIKDDIKLNKPSKSNHLQSINAIQPKSHLTNVSVPQSVHFTPKSELISPEIAISNPPAPRQVKIGKASELKPITPMKPPILHQVPLLQEAILEFINLNKPSPNVLFETFQNRGFDNADIWDAVNNLLNVGKIYQPIGRYEILE